MNERILIYVGALCLDDLYNPIDEMNTFLPNYEVALIHLDTRDYIMFTPTKEAKTDDEK